MEIELAEVEMPGLMSCIKEFGPAQPLAGANISGSLHMTIQVRTRLPSFLAPFTLPLQSLFLLLRYFLSDSTKLV